MAGLCNFSNPKLLFQQFLSGFGWKIEWNTNANPQNIRRMLMVSIFIMDFNFGFIKIIKQQ